ncbi:MAG: diguanylate cyclase domain-containing protein, partial [Blastocatellia bacterium]
ISLFDPNKSEFEIVHAIGRHAEVFARRRIPVNAGITGWVIQNQRPMFNTNPVLDLGFLGSADAAEYKAVLVFPLVKHQQALGAIALYSTELETYPSEYIQLIESISQPVSDSIHNALAFEQAQRAALTDPVTGLANMKSFSGQFDRETARSRRSGMPLSVMVATVVPISTTPTPTDWEQAMASIGELIRHCLRETDLIARQGRNSFVALLPDSGRVESAEVIARIQAAISPETASVISLTMTFGTSPDDGETIEDLTRAAASRGVLRASGITDQLNLPSRSSFPASSAGA